MNDKDKVPTTYQIRLWLRDDQQADFMAWLAEHDAEVERAVEERGYERGYADGWHKFPKETR